MQECHKKTMRELLIDNGYQIVQEAASTNLQDLPCHLILRAWKPILWPGATATQKVEAQTQRPPDKDDRVATFLQTPTAKAKSTRSTKKSTEKKVARKSHKKAPDSEVESESEMEEEAEKSRKKSSKNRERSKQESVSSLSDPSVTETHKWPRGGELIVFFVKGDKLGVKHVNKIIEFQQQYQIPVCIGVGNELTPNTRKTAKEVKLPYQLILFTLKRLVFNWSHHNLFGRPVHVIVDHEEQKALLDKIKITKSALPMITCTDGICEYYMTRPGDIIISHADRQVSLCVPND